MLGMTMLWGGAQGLIPSRPLAITSISIQGTNVVLGAASSYPGSDQGKRCGRT